MRAAARRPRRSSVIARCIVQGIAPDIAAPGSRPIHRHQERGPERVTARVTETRRPEARTVRPAGTRSKENARLPRVRDTGSRGGQRASYTTPRKREGVGDHFGLETSRG